MIVEYIMILSCHYPIMITLNNNNKNTNKSNNIESINKNSNELKKSLID